MKHKNTKKDEDVRMNDDGMDAACNDHAAQHGNTKPGRNVPIFGMSLFLNILDQQFRKPGIHNYFLAGVSLT